MRNFIRSALLACLCCIGAVWAQGTSQDAMTDRVLPCTACHGEEGRATPDGYFPRIAGKPAGYLYNQLRNFREGRRSYPQMAYLLTHLTDSYLYAMVRSELADAVGADYVNAGSADALLRSVVAEAKRLCRHLEQIP